ncbi:MAG: hypothetical protein ABI321_08060 [Polyangia bacterium]
MGKVWLLRDERIGRRVAQKALLESIDDPGMRARFLREARLHGQLEHPRSYPSTISAPAPTESSTSR